MTRVVTFGEVMLRLKPPGRERFFQSPAPRGNVWWRRSERCRFAGAAWASNRDSSPRCPDGEIGDACIGELRRHGVDTSAIRRQGERLGVYYLENGANQRPSKVIYDRAGSSIATASASDFNWNDIFEGADWFHVTGVTPAISASAADAAIAAATAARAKGLTVSCDYNYRAKLWKYGRKAPDVMRELVGLADVGIANEEDCQKALGIGAGRRREGRLARFQRVLCACRTGPRRRSRA